ncbi:hypothetical protein EXT66_20890 [Pectobacterium carotovorum subsp. carotovorum]|nr:hypothetical protein [Pectobacterium carotovorum subsp. carotovorum]MCL6349207.1 hypothetical protein [Pectobacterium carotovorum subsp. carotovorum]MCL6403712.1 hypothetical protein [Pectobacterium carotovorum subsp. carotovorum]
MLDRQKLEETVIEIARQSGEQMDRHTLYAIRNDVRNALAAKERHQQRMSAAPYQWKKPSIPRR